MDNKLKSAPTAGFSGTMKYLLREHGIVFTFFVCWIAAMLFLPAFAKLQNNINILNQASISLIASVGMMMVLITGGIDLSLGYLVGMVSIISGILIKLWNWPLVVVLLVAVFFGVIVGMVNGFIIVRLKVPPFVATLSTGYIVLGIAQIIGARVTIHNLPTAVKAFARLKILSIPIYVYIALVVAFVIFILLNKTIFGRSLYSLGTNKKASFFSGLEVDKTVAGAYIGSAVCAAVCGVLFTLRVNSAQPDMGGSTFTFEAVTACVLGGVNLLGGSGKVSGCIFGIIMLKMIENILGIVGANPYLYQALSSVVILGAIVIENLKNKYF